MDTLKNQAMIAMQKNVHLFSLLGVMIVFAAAPIRTQNFQVRNISKPLVIQTSKAEPPRVAFDEIVNSNSTAKKYSNEWNLLKGNNRPSVNLNQLRQVPNKVSAIQFMQSRKVVLKEMSFSQQVALTEIQEQRAKQIEDQAWLSGLGTSEQKRVIAAQSQTQILEEDWSPPDLKTETAALIQKAQAAATAPTPKSPIQISFTDSSGKQKTPDSRSVPSFDPSPEANLGGRGFAAPSYEISGSVKLPVGGPLLPGYRVQVARFEDGSPQEVVNVDLRSNKYFLKIPELNGAIIAQLLNSEGQIVGEGSQRISKYDVAQLKNLPVIEMRARQSSNSGVLATFTGNSNALIENIQGREKGAKAKILYASFDTEGTTDESGSFQFDQVLKGSWSLMRTESKDHYPAIFLTEAGSDKKLPLFSEKMMRALKQIVADQKVASNVEENGSIVWGQISQDGKPIAGAQVDVEFQEAYRPIYFNSFLLPDPSLKATSENGYFAFVDLPEGFHSVVATRASQYFSHGNVIVDENALSVLEVKTALKKDFVQMKVFDAFTGNPGSAMIQMQSLPEEIEVSGVTAFDLPDVSRLSFLTSRPLSDSYIPTLQVYNDADEFVHVPLINKAWIDSIRAAQKINYSPNTSTVIGFVESDGYEVYLPHSRKYSEQDRIFFDAQGQLTEYGVPGGGFILFNVPAGVQSIVVLNKATDMINSQVIPADVDANVVLKVRF